MFDSADAREATNTFGGRNYRRKGPAFRSLLRPIGSQRSQVRRWSADTPPRNQIEKGGPL